MNTRERIFNFVFTWGIFSWCLIIALFFPSVIFELASLKSEFSKNGIQTSGVVIDAEYGSNCLESEPSCKPIVEFTNQQGMKKRFTDGDTATYLGFPVGSQVIVEYLPNQGDRARIYISSETRSGYDFKVLIVFSLIWLLAVFGLFSISRDHIFRPLFQKKDSQEPPEKEA